MRKIALYEYVGRNNTKDAMHLMRRFGLRQPKNVKEVILGLKEIIRVKGKEGVIEIAKIHPDKNLIGSVNEPIIEDTVIEKKSNACGCSQSNACGLYASGHSGIDGSSNSSLHDEITKLKDKAKSITKEDIKNEIKKSLTESRAYVTNNITAIALLGLGIYAAIKLSSK